ncbi:MAG: sulfoxide reductase heme-binding subunit YedZ [Rhodospirillaceae bacterium]|nr:sulfoxide reductase heme-binding subunit YedZ [Rhodospirillaceae bacterium]
MKPWTDRTGALSPLRAPVFLALFVPGLWLMGLFLFRQLGPRPLTELVHESGLWTIRLLFLSLAITPLRRILRWPELISVRRMIGVAALVYALLHLLAYTADQAFDLGRVASEIVLRLYLAVGFVALLALVPLGITSTDGMIKRLGGKKWRRLHQLAYAIVLLGMVHFFWQAKLDAAEALVMAGVLLWLYGYRALEALRERPPLPLFWTMALSLVAGAATALGEAAYYHLRFNAPFGRVFDANFVWGLGWRPSWVVLAICLGAAAASTLAIAIQARRKRGASAGRRAKRDAALSPAVALVERR